LEQDMARILRQIAAMPLALMAADPAHAAPAAAAGQRPAAPPVQGGVAVSIDRWAGFTLVTHNAGITEAERSRAPLPPDLQPLHSRVQKTHQPGYRSANFRRARYLRSIAEAEARFGLPPGLLDALVWTESRYNPFAVSNAGAIGLGQLMPGTARDMGVRNRMDPLANINGAARYLRLLIDKFGAVHLALAAYNAGPAAVLSARGIPLNVETPQYVRDVLRVWRSATSPFVQGSLR
jgi:soluble lytic murein transglycosylase-like protein